jgi:hypothetical protein
LLKPFLKADGESSFRGKEGQIFSRHLPFLQWQADNLEEVEARLKALCIPTVKASVEENGVMVTQV